jgi:membrane dipeptidase
MIREFIGLGIFDKDRNPDLTLFPTDLNVSDRMDVLAGLLSARGFSDARIEKVLGANFARVMTEVWG